MSRKPKLGKCVHCLRDKVVLTRDHVFPKAWYPDNATAGLQKWQIPACRKCNDQYGVLEGEMQLRLGLCVDPRIAAASGILEKARRAIDPAAARTPRDRRARAALRKKLSSQILVGDQIPTTGIYPGLEERWGRPKAEQLALTIPKESFVRLTRKIVRGIFWLRDRRFIEPPYTIEFYALDMTAGPIANFQYGDVYAHEPGIRVTCLVVPDDRVTSAFEIEIWGTFKMHAFVGRDSATPQQVDSLQVA